MKLNKTLAIAATAAMMATNAMAGEIFAIGGKPDDRFWAIVKRGIEDASAAAATQGNTITWLGLQNYDNLGGDAAELIRQAIDQGADGIIAPDWVPEAMDSAFNAVADAGIPFIVYNAGGLEKAQELGALNFVGADVPASGEAGGKALAAAGYKNGVCINTLPGLANIEAMCSGFEKGITEAGGTYDVLPLPATTFGSATAVAQAVRAYLLKNPEVNAIFTIGDADSVSSVSGIAQAGKTGQVGVCGFNFNESVLQNIQNGTQLCVVDQQGYQQGYYAASILSGYIAYGATIASPQILTGPGIVDASNVEATMAGVKEGTR